MRKSRKCTISDKAIVQGLSVQLMSITHIITVAEWSGIATCSQLITSREASEDSWQLDDGAANS